MLLNFFYTEILNWCYFFLCKQGHQDTLAKDTLSARWATAKDIYCILRAPDRRVLRRWWICCRRWLRPAVSAHCPPPTGSPPPPPPPPPSSSPPEPLGAQSEKLDWQQPTMRQKWRQTAFGTDGGQVTKKMQIKCRLIESAPRRKEKVGGEQDTF